ncbi:dioxygenase family protein [Hymenobacter jeollabukensis]|uniref:Intradiol ring-cleavage dioxygenase n=1 Tax=Hymenobacter jeollabukensis TaxID=2025313 RepID=A0A5R8WMQ8_9BACT|nr:intradiol ring-cleavage dioxygenase [Hymenobacter jeollabukensis]TLM91028.1 intradiol ring-cleavage dioxygenase [Hymenobacter jeollabukensis]
MERKHFLKSLLVGAVSAPALLSACGKDEVTPDAAGSSTTGGTTGSGGSCSVAPTETEGPFPTKQPASYVRADIRDGKAGHLLTAKITITNTNNGCAGLAGALVDIWHCDAEGNYSEYGGTGMQSTNYQAVHFLRGRQTTDASGLVTFTSIFPGWYSGRATHIHVHVYSASGQSLKVTQIAFPEGSGSAVAAVNGYAKGLSGYTTNATDNVFSDGVSLELAAVTGNTTDGFQLSIALGVPA